jgi:hypothetical protein
MQRDRRIIERADINIPARFPHKRGQATVRYCSM